MIQISYTEVKSVTEVPTEIKVALEFVFQGDLFLSRESENVWQVKNHAIPEDKEFYVTKFHITEDNRWTVGIFDVFYNKNYFVETGTDLTLLVKNVFNSLHKPNNKWLVAKEDFDIIPEYNYGEWNDIENICHIKKGTYFEASLKSPKIYLDNDGDGFLYIPVDKVYEVEVKDSLDVYNEERKSIPEVITQG